MPTTDRVGLVGEVVTRDPAFVITTDERDAILEVAYLAIAADRSLRDDELAAFRIVAERLRDRTGKPGDAPAAAPPSENRRLSQAELDAVLDKFAAGISRADADTRLRALAGRLARPEARRGAYKIAYALALSDLDTSDAEFEFDLQLIESLGLSQEEAEELAGEVVSVFNGAA